MTAIEDGVPLARLTTIGTGGPGARVRAAAHARRARARRSRWAAERRARASRPSGSARTCSPPTTGVDALVLRLAGELAAVERRGELLVAGGGATNAVCLHRARAAGLGGFEFACAIPGTAGGGVWMNAGAYGGDWSDDPRPRARRHGRRRAAG